MRNREREIERDDIIFISIFRFRLFTYLFILFPPFLFYPPSTSKLVWNSSRFSLQRRQKQLRNFEYERFPCRYTRREIYSRYLRLSLWRGQILRSPMFHQSSPFTFISAKGNSSRSLCAWLFSIFRIISDFLTVKIYLRTLTFDRL